MIPIPAATTTIANMLVTSQPVFDMFRKPMFFEMGLMVAALLIVFVIWSFSDAVKALFGYRKGDWKLGKSASGKYMWWNDKTKSVMDRDWL